MPTFERIKYRNVLVLFLPVLIAASLLAQAPKGGVKDASPFSSIVFISSRHDTTLTSPAWLTASEIFIMNADGTKVRRLTQNTFADGFPALSPNGRRIVFESNRLRKSTDPINWASLFVINTDGTGETALVTGNSASWSADNKHIAFHASASGTGKPITLLPGAAAIDSDIFILDVDDFLRNKTPAKNITNNPDAVDDDPDWSSDGKTIVFTSHSTSDDQNAPTSAEIYTIDASGRKLKRLTNNVEEERAPDWSPDGKLIAYMCRRGAKREGRPATFEICIMDSDGSNQRRITYNDVPELTPTWSPDGKQLIFHRAVGGPGQFQLFTINADGTGEKQITFPPGFSGFANWGLAN